MNSFFLLLDGRFIDLPLYIAWVNIIFFLNNLLISYIAIYVVLLMSVKREFEGEQEVQEN